jgi:hypothetical protein
MPDRKPLPEAFSIPRHAPPDEAHYAWLGRAERLLVAFEHSLPEPSSRTQVPSLGFILMVADYVWDSCGEQADFANFDVQGFVAHSHALLCATGVAKTFAYTLVAFYDFLVASQEISPPVAQAIESQLSAAAAQLAQRS